MRVSRMAFYSVPIDSDYNNVYDDYSRNSELISFLGTPVFVLDDDKTIKMKGLYGEVVIKQAYYPSNDLSAKRPSFGWKIMKNVNYVVCRNATADDEWTEDIFFFITNVETLSDAPYANASCRLTLKYDSWTNCYKKNITTNQNFITTRHTPNIFKKGLQLFSNGRSLTTDFNSCYSMIRPVKSKFVIFRYLRISKNCVFKNNDVDGDINTGGLFPLEKDSIVVFIPWVVYDYDSKVFSSLIGVGTRNAYDYLSNVNTFSPYIIESWYSALFPCKYNVISAGVYNAYQVTFGEDASQNANIVEVSVRQPDGLLEHEFISRAYTIIPSTFDYEPCIEIDYNTPLPISAIDMELNDSYGDGLVYDFNNEAGLYTYPNDYNTIKIADSFIKLETPQNANYITKIIVSYSASLPIYNVQYDNDETVNFVLDVGFNAQTTTEAFQEFIAYRNNTFRTDVLNSILPSAFTLGAGILKKSPVLVASGASGIVKNLRSPKAELEDIYNNPYKYSGSTSRTNVYFYDLVDMPILVHHTILGNDKMKLAKMIHYYGANVDEMGNVYDNNRNVFDYVQTENCLLTNIRNDEMRLDLQNAFNRGVTKWHISSSQSFKNALKTLNRDIYNGQIGGY